MFGLDPVDDASVWDPRSSPAAKLRGNTDLTAVASQQFLRDLSDNARSASWFDPAPSDWGLPPSSLAVYPRYPWNSTFDILLYQAERPCSQLATSCAGGTACACCGLSRASFPFAPAVFQTCLAEMAGNPQSGSQGGDASQPAVSGKSWSDLIVGAGANVFFDASGTPKVLSLVFVTTTFYSEEYVVTKVWWEQMQAWMEAQMAPAPAGLVGGFVSVPWGSLNYYSLQTAMASSSQASSMIALIIVCVVLVCVTANVFIAVYTTATVLLIILTVAGILTQLGWEQGIMESIIFSCGIGMACDFAAHIGFAYRQANARREATTRGELAKLAIRRMLPALTAAAFSTAVMGLFMIGAGTLFTIRFGIFIVLLMVFGWLYATFFLLPLLAALGPLGACGDLLYPFRKKEASLKPVVNA